MATTCPNCGTEHDLPECPECMSQPAKYGPEHDLHLVTVYRAEDEMSAHLIHGALTNNGVRAHIHSEQAPMFGALLRMDHGCWGEVMVPEAYKDEALAIVEAFTHASPGADEALAEEAMAAPPEDEG